MPNIKLTKRSNTGTVKVYVDGSEFSSHNEEKEAIESAINEKFNSPNSTIHYETSTVVDLEITGIEDVSEPTPTDPVEEPTDPPTEPEEPPTTPTPVEGILTTEGGNLVDGADTNFQFNGTNAYYLPNYQIIDSRVVDRAFEAFQLGGVKMIRTWGFYDGAPIYDNDNPMQPNPQEYNEEALVALDQVIARGKELGMRFVIPFVNYWNELGGIAKYVEWATGTSDRNMHTFITNARCQEIFKDYISMILNRVNTVTGVAYKDEPAIAMWEIGNEIRNPNGGAQELRDWYQEIAQYIKGIDPNHLLATGEEGYEDPSLGTWNAEGKFINERYSSLDYSNTYVLRADQGTSFIMNTQIPEIDVATCHWYPNVFGFGTTIDADYLKSQEAFILDHQRIAQEEGKAMFIGEYGFEGHGDERVLQTYADIYRLIEENNIAGSLLWQLTADWVKCWEFGGNICYPAGREDTEIFNAFKTHSDNLV